LEAGVAVAFFSPLSFAIKEAMLIVLIDTDLKENNVDNNPKMKQFDDGFLLSFVFFSCCKKTRLD
jgi:hypothetical protein